MQTLEQAIIAALKEISQAQNGIRNEMISKQAYFLGGLIHYGADPNRLENEIVEASSLPTSEARATARNGLKAGQLRPIFLSGNHSQTRQSARQREQMQIKALAAQKREQEQVKNKRRWAVNSLWDSAAIIPDWITYPAKTRGLEGCNFGGNIRFLPRLKYWQQGEPVSYWPALIIAARKHPQGEVKSCFRLYLSHDGSTKAPISKPRLAAASFRGLGHWVGKPNSDTLIICEGVENAYSLQMMRDDNPLICAAFSSGNMANITPPKEIKKIILAGDNDKAGQAANSKAAAKFRAQGYEVSTIIPPKGQDWNDQLLQAQNGGVK